MRYWVYLAGEVPGHFEPKELAGLPGFSGSSLVCPFEGELSERRWQPASIYADIVRALGERPASAPERGALPSEPLGSDDLLDQTSLRLFQHVSSLMNELRSRREDRSSLDSMRRALDEARRELDSARSERGELETELRGELDAARKESAQRQREIDHLRERADADGDELAAAGEKLERANRLLAERELTLAKALAALGRLEKELAGLIPASGEPAAAPPHAPPAPPSGSISLGTAGKVEPLPAAPSGSISLGTAGKVEPLPAAAAVSLEADLADALAPPPPPEPVSAPPPAETLPSVMSSAPPLPAATAVEPPWRQALDRALTSLKSLLP